MSTSINMTRCRWVEIYAVVCVRCSSQTTARKNNLSVDFQVAKNAEIKIDVF